MNNKTFKLFISSTFDDFKREREILNIEVYKELSAFCKNQGYDFEIVDLQWGISQNIGWNQLTVPTCIKEVERCKNGLNPNLFIMLGDRRGWVPLPTSIEKNIYKKLVKYMSDDELALVERWYRLDKNLIPERYILQARYDEMLDNELWKSTEDKIRSILQEAALRALPREVAIHLCFKSVTEKEIDAGFLQIDGDALQNQREHKNIIALFRHYRKDDTKEYVDKIKNNIKSENQLDFNLNEYPDLIENKKAKGLDKESKSEKPPSSVLYERDFFTNICEKLKSNIQDEIDRIKKQPKSTKQILEEYTKEYNQVFLQRKDEIALLQQYIDGDFSYIQFLTGPSGSGKTALLAKLYQENKEKNLLGYFREIDNSPNSLLGILENILFSLSGKQYHLQYYNAVEEFWKLLSLCEIEKEYIILLDAVDTYYDYFFFKEDLFSRILPTNLKFIVSAIEGFLPDFYDSAHILNLTAFSFQDSSKIFREYLKSKNHCLTYDQTNSIRKSLLLGILPVEIKILASLCCNIRSYEKISIKRTTPSSLIVLLVDMMVQKYGHSKKLVQFVLSILALAPDGITMNELRELCYANEEVRESCLELDTQKEVYSTGMLPMIYLSRLFYDLESNLQTMISHGQEVIIFSHNIYKNIVKELYPLETKKAHSMLIDFFEKQPSYYENQVVNMRKAYSLLPLVYEDEQRMSYLLTDKVFISSVIASGQLSYILELWSMRWEKIRDQKIYSCILNHYEDLHLYPDCFLAFYQNDYKENLEYDAFFSQSNALSPSEDFLSFPYKKGTKALFSPDSQFFLVFQDDKLYLWRTLMRTEIYHIGIPVSMEEDYQILWIEEKEFILCDHKKLYHYKIQNESIVCYHFYEFQEKGPRSLQTNITLKHIVYRYELEKIFLIIQSKLLNIVTLVYQIDLKTKKILSSIELTEKNFNGFYWREEDDMPSIFSSKHTLFPPDCFLQVKVNQKLTLPVKETKIIGKNKFLLLYSEETWQEGNALTACSMIEDKYIYYICPPNISKLKHILPGTKTAVFVYEDIILVLDLHTLKFIRKYHYDGETVLCAKEDSYIGIMKKKRIFFVGFSIMEKIEEDCYITTKRKIVENKKKVSPSHEITSSDKNEFSILKGSAKYQKATMAAVSSNAKYAIAYETRDQIVIYEQGTIHSTIHYHFTIDHCLVKMFFSKCQDYLILILSCGIKIYDLVENCFVRSKKKQDFLLGELLPPSSFSLYEEQIPELSITRQLEAREEEIETFIREKSSQNFQAYESGNKIILILPHLSSVLLLDSKREKILTAYYHQDGIIGGRIIDEHNLLFCDQNGIIQNLSLNEMAKKYIPKTSSRKKKGFIKRNKKQFITCIAFFCFFLIAGICTALYANRPIYYDIDNTDELVGNSMEIQYLDFSSEAFDSKEALYKTSHFQFQSTGKGILYKERQDFNHDKKKEILIIEEKNDAKTMNFTAYILDENYKILTTYQFPSIAAHYNCLIDFFYYERNDNQWILGFDYLGISMLDSSKLKYTEFISYEDNQFYEIIEPFTYSSDESDERKEYIFRSSLNKIGLDIKDVTTMIADYNEQLHIVSSIYSQKILEPLEIEALDFNNQTYPVSNISYMGENRPRLRNESDTSVESSSIYTDFDKSCSFQMAGLSFSPDSFKDKNDSTKISAVEEEYSMTLEWTSLYETTNIKEEFLKILYKKNILTYETEIMPKSYTCNDTSFSIKYELEYQNGRINGWYDKPSKRLYLLTLLYTPSHENEASLFENTVIHTLESVTPRSLHDTVIPINWEEKLGEYNNTNTYIEECYQLFLTDYIGTYLSDSSTERQYCIHYIDGKPKLYIINTTELNFGQTIYIFSFDEKTKTLKYDNIINMREVYPLYYSSNMQAIVGCPDSPDSERYEYKKLSSLDSANSTAIQKYQRDGIAYYFFVDEEHSTSLIQKEKYDAIIQSFGSLQKLEFHNISDIPVATESSHHIYHNYLNSNLTITVSEELDCHPSYLDWQDFIYYNENNTTSSIQLKIVSDKFDIDYWKKLDKYNLTYHKNSSSFVELTSSEKDNYYESMLKNASIYYYRKVQKKGNFYIIINCTMNGTKKSCESIINKIDEFIKIDVD